MKVSTVRALSSSQRRLLESAVVDGRRSAEAASLAALQSLGVTDDRVPAHLSEDQRVLRRGLRAKLRQLGGQFDLLVGECAYEQWHRLLFARFLAENDLLLHPQYRAPVTIAECEDLAPDLGEPDGWSVAARFAAEILPGIFRLDDPCVQLRLAPEGRLALERVVSGLPAQVFKADDSLGWVYQFWQKDKKDEINASERKIGGADLSPVTQLFTENYMVRFLLENSLGAWWAARYPDSPLVKEFELLRLDDDGSPAARCSEGWPDRVAEVTVMDPCCGSGHFLVEAFGMLWRMRAEEEDLDPVAAQDAVLRDNLYGIELDPRCVQIATFALALTAWKQGDGWRELPVPHVACSGIAVKAPVEEWRTLAHGDPRLEAALERLHVLFRDADTLGSLIDPRKAAEMDDAMRQRRLDSAEWSETFPLLERTAGKEGGDPAVAVLGADAAAIARVAEYLSRRYTLVATNPPFLGRGKHSTLLKEFCEKRYPLSKTDLGPVFYERCASLATGAVCMVLPQSMLFMASYSELRRAMLVAQTLVMTAWLGEGAFSSGQAAGAQVCLQISGIHRAVPGSVFASIDAAQESSIGARERALRIGGLVRLQQDNQVENPGARILPTKVSGVLFGSCIESYQGLKTGDNPRWTRGFWELDRLDDRWSLIQSAPLTTEPYAGRENVVFWERGAGELAQSSEARIQGHGAWNRAGVVVAEMRHLYSTLYLGEVFDGSGTAMVVRSDDDLAAVWAFCSSGELVAAARRVSPNAIKVTTGTMADIPFDVERWRQVAAEMYPDGLPDPWSDDPTQWLFEGRPEASTEPLHVAVGRLLGYQWPEQAEIDDLDDFSDSDGIVTLPSVSGEPPAAERLQRMLTVAFGSSWTPSKPSELLEESGSRKKNLGDWLRDDIFKQHCRLFQNRPFIWQIWDGRKDGFSALVNYHRLDRKTLEKLTYTYLGQDWVERQQAERREDVAGAEARLAAALDLQRKLEAILEGEPPFDVYIRWKSLEEQPIGWDPDLNDGVRLNVRPFVEAGVLRGKFNVHWPKDRGKNPDGSERHNDLHFSRAEKLDARKKAGRS